MPSKEDFNKRTKLLIVLALFLVLNIMALLVYFAIPENVENETGVIKNIETDTYLDESNLFADNNLAAGSFAKILSTSSSSSSSSHSSSRSPGFSSSLSSSSSSCCGIGSPDEECKDFGFDFGVSKWECEGSCCSGGSWKLDEEIYPGTSVTGCCSNATWDAGSSGADGIIVKSGNIEHGGYYYAVNGTNGSVILSKDISHITFCRYNKTQEIECGDGIINGDEECEFDSDCEDPVCEDKCIGNDYYEYEATENDCKDCSCEDNECEVKNISYNDARCLEPKCGDGKVDSGEECDDGDLDNDDECSNDCEINKCIIKLNKTESIDPIKAGEELSYYIKATNIGTRRCTGGGVQLKEYYDSNTIFLSSDPSPTSNNNLWNFGILDPGEKEEITINMQVNETAQCAEILINKICIWANELPDWQCITEQTSVDCPTECGDGHLDLGEECDDGNLDNFDECRNDCTLPYCGDLILDLNEQCEIIDQCPEKCTTESHKLYTEINCNECACDYSKYKCIIGKCGAVCDSNDDCQCEQDYCNGTTLYDYPENSTCGTSGSESCLCTTCTANIVYNSTECGYQEPKCGDGIINQIWEECDDRNNVNGDGCDENCKWEITCDDNSDCGEDGWINDDYCVCTTNVWDFWESFECKNPGTPNSYCTNKTEAKLKQECGSDSCTGWENYCKNNDAWKKQTCYDVGCALGACFNHTSINETLVQDCGEDSCDEPILYCKDNDVWKNQTCYDKGCSFGGCFNDPFTNKSKAEECGDDFTGEWAYYCDVDDVHRQRQEITRGCENGACFENIFWKDEFVEHCAYECKDAKCEEPEPYCGDGIVDSREECDDGNNVNGDGCDKYCKTEGCPDTDHDCICDQDDRCLNSRQGEMVNEDGCDPFQFCGQLSCGEECSKLDFIPAMQNCEKIQGEPEGQYPSDCTTVIVHKEGIPEPRCTPTTCAD